MPNVQIGATSELPSAPALSGFTSAVTTIGDSDKPAGTEGYDVRALAAEFRARVHRIGFGGGRPITLPAHDLGATCCEECGLYDCDGECVAAGQS